MRIQRSLRWGAVGLLAASTTGVYGWGERWSAGKEAVSNTATAAAGALGLEKRPPIEPGKCGVYRKGAAELSLCIDSVVEYGGDVQQVNAFLVNTGSVPVCDLKLKPVTSGRVYSFWPDWAEKASYEVYFTPKQVTAAGLTGALSQGSPASIEVSSFRDCAANRAADATTAVQYNTVPITLVQPKQGAAAEPTFMAASDRDVIPQGKCALYTKSDGSSLAYCVESVINWGSDVVQMNAFLTNTGKVPICNLQLQAEKDWKYYSVWPEWAETAAWVNNFEVNQTTAVGATAPARADRSFPTLTVTNFGACGGDGGRGQTTANVKIVDLSAVMEMQHPAKNSGWNFFKNQRWGSDAQDEREEEVPVVLGAMGDGHIVRYLKGRDERLQPGMCGVYSKPGKAQATLCLASVEHYDDSTQLSMFMVNSGEAKLCELRLSLDQDFTYIQIDPVWAQEGEFADNFTPGEAVDLTILTEAKPNGIFPYIAIDSFEICGKDPPAKPFRPSYERETIVEFQTKKASRALRQDNQEVASQPAIPAGKCAVYKNGTAELALCVDSVVEWGKDVQQVNGFLVNSGKTSVCKLKVAPVTSNPVQSFWPDWAKDSSSKIDFHPKSVTALGLTTRPGASEPYIEVVSFEPCGEKADPASVSLRLADIHEFQPEGTAHHQAAQRNLQGGHDSHIPEGKCGIFHRGGGSMALCVESIISWGSDVIQVNGFLENTGKDKLCNVKLATTGADKFYSVWPEWVADQQWVNDFQPGQSTGVGLTASVKNANGQPSHPELYLRNFDVCGHQVAGGVDRIVPDQIVDITTIKRPMHGNDAHSSTGRHLAAEASAPKVDAGRCGTFENGQAKLKLCVDPVQSWGNDVIAVGGELENVGSVPICDLRLGNSYGGSGVYSSWPEWAAKDRWESNFNVGQKIKTGFTAAPKMGRDAHSLSVLSFRDCSQAPDLSQSFHAVPTGVLASMMSNWRSTGGDRHLAAKPAPPTTMETIDWSQCGYFKGQDGQSELALCWKDSHTWNDKRKGRIVQANLILVNTGNFGVCNVTVYIENLARETGDHYPKWVDDDGQDSFPNYPGYFAPKQIVNIGAAVPVNKDFPEVYVEPTFTACSPEPPKPEKPRETDCQDIDKDGVQIKFCTYKDLKEWTDYKGPRYVMVEGYFENTGNSLACNVTVDIENYANAKASWGEWMPVFPYKLAPGQVVKYGANIPMKKGVPKTGLSHFVNCGAPGTRRLEEQQHDHEGMQHGGHPQHLQHDVHQGLPTHYQQQEAGLQEPPAKQVHHPQKQQQHDHAGGHHQQQAGGQQHQGGQHQQQQQGGQQQHGDHHHHQQQQGGQQPQGGHHQHQQQGGQHQQQQQEPPKQQGKQPETKKKLRAGN